ncbi:MAG TPA: hypothetical protein VN934_00190 [Candidatus Tumulicola sp.]|nr:hypothetical protein [Candidatus Tumulicola sp.]
MNRWTGLIYVAAVFVFALAAYLASSGGADTLYNNYVRLADAWLHGRVWVNYAGPGIDALRYQGHLYIIEAPLPALLVLPLVAIFGLGANQALVCVFCGAAAVAAAYVMLGRLGVSQSVHVWVLAFFAFGTGLWWCTAFGAVWMFAHVAGVMFAMFGLVEWYGKRRAWLLGLLLSCMALCRFPMAIAALPFLAWLLQETPSRERLRVLAGAVAGALPLFALYVVYNELRWHTAFDIGYTNWYHLDPAGHPTGSPFGVQYLPLNLYSFFLLAPAYAQHFPWFVPTGIGVALTFTSPGMALAFFAPLRNREAIWLWVAVLLTWLPSLLYYVNGAEQFGMRHSLDFLPFLLPLVARGLEHRPSVFAYSLIVLSIAVNAWGLWYSWAFHGFTVVPRR